MVDRECEPQSGQTKDYNIGICCFSAKNAALRRKSKDWFARNQDNVSDWVMSIRELMFQRSGIVTFSLQTEEERMFMEYRAREAEMIATKLLEDSERR
jgi:hypothetical protein